MMINDQRELITGSVGTYIHDFPGWIEISTVPEQAAILWLKSIDEIQDISMGGYKKVRDIESIDTDWLNKLFIVINDYPVKCALYNYDGRIKLLFNTRCDLIRRYLEISQHPDCDTAMD